MTYKLIIFDFDGVIVESNSPLRKVIDKFDKGKVGEELFASFISLIESPLPRTARNLKLRSLILRVAEELSDYRPNEGVVDFIRHINGYKMAIFSINRKDTIKEHLEGLGILGKFDDLIVSGEDVEKLKPSPAGLIWILADAKVWPHEAVYYGSGSADSDAARDARVKFVESLDELKRALDLRTSAPH
jgi:haloacid dehalogenase superfamily, subfamily IA, variant 1 with third motif having Dx(3-4)D or Dx(3-4)E